jgi:TfoX/Sxy family transcriptional regulator of competence genes
MPNVDPKKYSQNLALYEELVATNPKVERKGDTMSYTSVNGHMFSLLTKEGWLALRLPEDEREAFLRKYKTKLAVQYGTVMKEYVQVPEALLKKTSELRKLFNLSYEYASSLKPKPTKRTAPAKEGAAKKR